MMALLVLALAFFLLWHGMARAEDFAPPQNDTTPPATSQAAPAAPGCSDNMDFSPEDNLPSPFDADEAAFRRSHAPLMVLRPIATDDNCQSAIEQPRQV
jgi:hypothetical protein